ncbi:hypothetical protein BC827DRAFT_1155986 [Russula dissimulans]|nr:hypothetical protein BC827DRAFT_1155986 [Russula dissimulans]
MAAVVAPTAFHSSSHLFPPHRDNFAAFHRQPHPRGPALLDHNPFEAFAPHHHSSTHSRSTTASWRHSKPVPRAPVPSRTPSPKNRRAGPSHSRIPSAEASTISWRLHRPSPGATKVDVPQEPDVSIASSNPRSKVSTPFVYSVAELLQLSASPLVGISKESQIIVDNLVAHHVWRRGPQSGATGLAGRRKSRSSSRSRLVHTSTDDSENSD